MRLVVLLWNSFAKNTVGAIEKAAIKCYLLWTIIHYTVLCVCVHVCFQMGCIKKSTEGIQFSKEEYDARGLRQKTA